MKGKTWTGFANAEEQYADNFMGMKIQPYWIEEEARKIPETTFKVKPAFTPMRLLTAISSQGSSKTAVRWQLSWCWTS